MRQTYKPPQITHFETADVLLNSSTIEVEQTREAAAAMAAAATAAANYNPFAQA